MLLVIGIGTEFRRDDAVGLAVARLLAAMDLPGVTITQHSGESAGLIDTWKDADSVVLVDAVRAGGRPGAITRIDAHDLNEKGSFGAVSSHSFGIGEAVKLARIMGCLPPKLVIYGVEAESFEQGTGLSPEVEAAVSEVVACIVEELACTSLV